MSSYWRGKRVLVAGGGGFIGAALTQRLYRMGARVRVADARLESLPAKLGEAFGRVEAVKADLTDPAQAESAARGIDVVMNLAAKVGGIGYNHDHQADMCRINTTLSLNMIEAARKAGVERYLVVSSACVYGKDCPMPMSEADGFLGDPEASNYGYGWAKRYSEIQAKSYARQYGMKIAIARPFNAYGPWDRFDESGHVIASLIRRVCAGESPLTIWGTGKPTRSFIYSDDFADGLLLLAESYACAEPVNLCDGREVSIAELAQLVCAAAGVAPPLRFDAAKPDGQPRRLGDTRLAESLGFKAKVGLEDGLRRTVEWYRRELLQLPCG